ncbi:hypothetical protein KUTeg_005174 [Tegillarca granosa]|uniref:DNA repair metallo-beta-lactamase domain-containing protein n=1 Tax=Tegillarca granosa TaxID=220873 RepID=A0ABQ9FJ07_TEGGR|nr:hypothetical protein KUTeg_005174 [Tegillarca granosa]
MSQKFYTDLSERKFYTDPSVTKVFYRSQCQKFYIDPSERKFYIDPSEKKFYIDPSVTKVLCGSKCEKCEKFYIDPSVRKFYIDPSVTKFYTDPSERKFYIDPTIAKALNCNICVLREKKNILDCIEDPFITKHVSLNWEDSQLHVLPMGKLNQKGLREHVAKLKTTYTSILALEPTGWTFNNKLLSLEQIKPKFKREEITVYGVPYSEHSSFLELKRFVQFLKPDKILPTVNNGNPNSRKKMESIFKSWKDELKTILNIDTNGEKNTTVNMYIHEVLMKVLKNFLYKYFNKNLLFSETCKYIILPQIYLNICHLNTQLKYIQLKQGHILYIHAYHNESPYTFIYKSKILNHDTLLNGYNLFKKKVTIVPYAFSFNKTLDFSTLKSIIEKNISYVPELQLIYFSPSESREADFNKNLTDTMNISDIILRDFNINIWIFLLLQRTQKKKKKKKEKKTGAYRAKLQIYYIFWMMALDSLLTNFSKCATETKNFQYPVSISRRDMIIRPYNYRFILLIKFFIAFVINMKKEKDGNFTHLATNINSIAIYDLIKSNKYFKIIFANKKIIKTCIFNQKILKYGYSRKMCHIKENKGYYILYRSFHVLFKLSCGLKYNKNKNIWCFSKEITEKQGKRMKLFPHFLNYLYKIKKFRDKFD